MLRVVHGDHRPEELVHLLRAGRRCSSPGREQNSSGLRLAAHTSSWRVERPVAGPVGNGESSNSTRRRTAARACREARGTPLRGWRDRLLQNSKRGDVGIADRTTSSGSSSFAIVGCAGAGAASRSNGRSCVMAHPDDVDFGAAGTVAALTDAGVDVTYCIVTDGDAGGFDRTIAARRDRRASGKPSRPRRPRRSVSPTSCSSATRRTGRSSPTLDLRRDITRVIRQVRPTRRHHASRPSVNLDRIHASHPDHLATGEATLSPSIPTHATRSPSPSCSPRASSRGRSTRCGCVRRRRRRRTPSTSPISFDRKIAALLAHRSQHPRPRRHAAAHPGLERGERRRLRVAGRATGRGLPRRRHPLTSMALLRFSFGTMGSGKSTVALQIHHNLSSRELYGLLLTCLDREGDQVTSRLGVAAPAIDVPPTSTSTRWPWTTGRSTTWCVTRCSSTRPSSATSWPASSTSWRSRCTRSG